MTSLLSCDIMSVFNPTPFVLHSMMGSHSAISHATPPSTGPKVQHLVITFKMCVCVCVHFTGVCVWVSGVNIGGAGSYVYDAPANEAPAAVSMETDGKPEEVKKAPARGPVKGETLVLMFDCRAVRQEEDGTND